MAFKQTGRRICVILATIGLILLPPQLSGQSTKDQPQSVCSVAISNPLPNARVNETSIVSGTARLPKIPVGSHLWLLSHLSTLNGWWPQGGGETRVKPDGTWKVLVQFGESRDRGEFEVVAIVVDDSGNNNLNSWVNTAAQTGRYPSITFPSTIEGCLPVYISVMK